MKFSVIIPLYNKQDSIRRALFSVFDQVDISSKVYEIIVVDDGSSDRSLAIVNNILNEYKEYKVIVYSQENAGVSAARNRGIALASAEYITFLDADDTYEPNFLRTVEHLIFSFPQARLFATAYRFVNTVSGLRRNARIVGIDSVEEELILPDFFFSAAYGDLPVTSSSVCILKNALESIGGFPTGENMGEDQAVWSQIALKYPIALSQKVCANYFEGAESSLMNTVIPNNEMPFSQRLQQQLDNNEVSESKAVSIKVYIAGHLLDLARRNIQSGDTRCAKLLLSDSRTRLQFKRWVYWSIRLKCKVLLECIVRKPKGDQ
jgi:glycosyltransferase involved in cell wall biosynthesis